MKSKNHISDEREKLAAEHAKQGSEHNTIGCPQCDAVATGCSQPVLSIQTADKRTTFEIHAYRAGQSCRITKGATMEFGASIGSKSAGLVYVCRDANGIRAEDNHVDNPVVWGWIQRHMQTGLSWETRLQAGGIPQGTAAPVMDDADAIQRELTQRSKFKSALERIANLSEIWTDSTIQKTAAAQIADSARSIAREALDA
jgi:hypothetical protein